MRTTWEPGFLDVSEVPVQYQDPEAALFDEARSWIFVSSTELLQSVADGMPHSPSEDAVLVVCIEAVREAPSISGWRDAARRVFFVRREEIRALGIGEGIVAYADRFRLRDCAFIPISV